MRVSACCIFHYCPSIINFKKKHCVGFSQFISAIILPWPASVMVLNRRHQPHRQSPGAAAPVSGMLGPVMMMMPMIMMAPTTTTSVKNDKKKNRTSQVTFALATPTPIAGASSTSALSVDSLATSTTELGASASSSTAEDAEVERKFQQTSRFKFEDISHFAENVGRCLFTVSKIFCDCNFYFMIIS